MQTLSAQFKTQEIERKSQTLSDQISKVSSTVHQIQTEKLLNHLSFSHFVELIKINDPLTRTYYEIECIKGTWSVRELKRQINSLSFERSAAAIIQIMII